MIKSSHASSALPSTITVFALNQQSCILRKLFDVLVGQLLAAPAVKICNVTRRTDPCFLFVGLVLPVTGYLNQIIVADITA